MSAAPKFTPLPERRTRGPVIGDGCCERCGRALKGDDIVPLELDQRVNEYHDFGGVPDDQSQGWFDFGRDCARLLRIRARAALAKVDA